MVINPHDYRRGLEKLGVIQNDQQSIDLRKNPAFAWRVLVAYVKNKSTTTWQDIEDLMVAMQDLTPADALYAAVEKMRP